MEINNKNKGEINMKNQEKSKYLGLGILIGMGIYKGINTIKKALTEIEIIGDDNIEPEFDIDMKE